MSDELIRCRIPGCTWHVDSSTRGLCYAHELWRTSFGAGIIALRPVPTAEQIFQALRKFGGAVKAEAERG